MFEATVLQVAALMMCCGHLANGPEKSSDFDGPIATSGEVEIRAIRLNREKVAYAAKDADLSYTKVDLWFRSKTEFSKTYLVRITDIELIIDNSGRELTTKKRLAALPFLRSEVTVGALGSGTGEAGPEITLTLDVPAKQATAIKAIKGKAVVSQISFDRYEFALAKIDGRPLAHPKIRDVKIEANIRVKDNYSTVTLRVPRKNAGLVGSWGVGIGETMIPTDGSGRSESSEFLELQRSYRGQLADELKLILYVGSRGKSKTFEFDFKNIELP